MPNRIYLTSMTCESKSQKITISHIDTEKHYKAGPISHVVFDNGGDFTVSADVLGNVGLGKTYSIWLEEIEPELVEGVSPQLIKL